MTAENKAISLQAISALALFSALASLSALASSCAEPARDPSSSSANGAAPAARAASDDRREKSALTFIDDDYPRALAEAKQKNVPLFVDAWAPWCHSCLSMREYVLHDPALSSLKDQFVFLAIDTERESNKAFTSKYQNSVWPTLFVIDAATEKARVKWGGTATTRELVTFLTDAALAKSGASAQNGASGGSSDPARAAFIRGNADVAMGDLDHAETDLRDALSHADARDSERPRIVEALTSVLWEREKYGDCASLVIRETPNMPHGSSRTTALATAIDCASEGKIDATSLVEIGVTDLAHEDAALLADDRSSLFDSVIEALDAKKDPRAKSLASDWVAFLDREASRAKTNESRAVFDAHRVLAYSAAGRPRDAIPMLERSLAEFPDDYNPSARLAKVYFDVKDLEHARANIDRAFAKVYGPRTLRIADLGAKIALAQQKPSDAIAFYRAAIERTRELALTEKQVKQVEVVKKKLSALQAGATSLSAE